MSALLKAAAEAEAECTGFLGCAVDGGKDLVDGAIGAGADIIGGVGDAVSGVGDAVDGAVGAASDFANFWSDPMGNMFLALQDGARNLSEGLLPALTGAIMPDLTADWFIQAYKISFALSIFVFVVILIPQIIRTARGQQSGRDLAESLSLYAPAFILGAMFGPALGAFLVKFFSALSNDLIAWGIEGSTDTLVTTFTGMLSEDNALGFAGGAVVGALLMVLMILGLLIVLLVLIVQLITLYFSGVLFPLGLVWIVDPQKRAFGAKIAYLWLGILASHPLLFFLLGISYSMIAASTSIFNDVPTLEKTVTLVVSVLALLIAGFSPLLLAKFAPVLPMGGGGQASPSAPIGSKSMQEADSKLSGPSDSSSPSTTSNSAAADQSDSAPSTNSTSSSNSSGGTSTGGAEDPASSSISDAAAGKSGGAAGGSTAGGAQTLGASSSAAAAGGATAAEGATATTAAAGAAETATGAGAVVGIPTMVAAGAAAAAQVATKAYKAAESGAESTADIAGSAVDDHEQHYGKDSTHE